MAVIGAEGSVGSGFPPGSPGDIAYHQALENGRANFGDDWANGPGIQFAQQQGFTADNEDKLKRASPGSAEQAAAESQYSGGRTGGRNGYSSPGSATYDPNGDYARIPLEDATKNDAAQALAASQFNSGLSAMQNRRGDQSVENGVLVGREAQGRAGQNDALNLDMQAAMGNAPSEAAFQTSAAMNGLMGSNAGAMGGARGLSALNGAGLGGAVMAQNASGIGQAGGQGRSKEISDAMGQFGSLAGDTREADLSRLAGNSQNSNFNADLNDRWQMGNGQNALAAGKLGNELELSDQQRYGASMQPAETQLQADQAMQGFRQGANADKSAIANSKAADKRRADHDLYSGIGGSVVTGIGTAAGGPVGGGVANAAWKYGNS